MATQTTTALSRASALVAFAGWVLMLAGTAYVYSTFMSSQLNISQALNPSVLYNPSFTPHKNRYGYGSYHHTTTTSELDDSDARGLSVLSYAWYFNDTDVLVEGYMWWIVAFQLFGVIYSVATNRKLAALSMHVVLTASTFIYTRTVLSGYIFCLLRTLGEHRSGFHGNTFTDTVDKVKAGLAVLFAGCVIVDVGNVMTVHALAYEVEASLMAKPSSAVQVELSPQVGV